MMNTYRVTYYNSGGYKSRIELKTDYTIARNAEGEFILYADQTSVGDRADLENLVLATLGFHEDITIVRCELLNETE